MIDNPGAIAFGATMMIDNTRYELIDLTYILEVADGDREFMEQSLSGYMASIPESLDKLSKALAAHDAEAASFCAHTLKGAYSFMGCNILADMMDKVEREYQPEGTRDIEPGLIPEARRLSAIAMNELADVLHQLDGK